MTDVKVTEHKKENNEITVTDKKGRKITIRRPSLLDNANFLLALGEAADNKAYMNQFGFINWVSSINGEKVFQPTSKLEVDAIINHLDHDGYEAVLEGFVQFVEQNVKDEKTAVEDVKK